MNGLSVRFRGEEETGWYYNHVTLVNSSLFEPFRYWGFIELEFHSCVCNTL